MNENKALIKWLRDELKTATEELKTHDKEDHLYDFWLGKKQTIEETLTRLGVITEVDFKQTSVK